MDEGMLREDDKARLLELAAQVTENLLHNKKLKGELGKIMNGAILELKVDKWIEEAEARVRAEEQRIFAEQLGAQDKKIKAGEKKLKAGEKKLKAGEKKLKKKDKELEEKDKKLEEADRKLAEQKTLQENAVRTALQNSVTLAIIQQMYPELSENDLQRIAGAG